MSQIARQLNPSPRPTDLRVGRSVRDPGSPPRMLNLHVMVAARFADADQAEALDRLSAAIAFFRRRPVIDQSNTPDLDSRIERLVLDIENLSRSELSALWAIHGGRPLPSVLCRVRLVAFDADQLSGRVSPAAHPPTTRDAHRDPHPGGV